MLNNKRGISAIVATVLIILITVAAVTIIWATVIPMISESVSNTDILSSRVDIVTSSGYTVYDSSTGNLYVQVKQVGNLSKIELVVTSGGNSQTIELEGVPGNNQMKTYNVDLDGSGSEGYFESLEDVIFVQVVPYVLSGSEEKEGTPSAKVEVRSSVIASEPECDANHLNLCDESNCVSDGGGYWYDSTCNSEAQECTENSDCDEKDCQTASCNEGVCEYTDNVETPNNNEDEDCDGVMGINDCSFTATVDGGNYLLLGDIEADTTDSCIIIQDDNIVINGNGYSMSGLYSSSSSDYKGIYANGKSNITIKNFGLISQFDGAVSIKNVDGAVIENSSFISNSLRGQTAIEVDTSKNIDIRNNFIEWNTSFSGAESVGISLIGVNDSLVYNNTVSVLEAKMDIRGIFVDARFNGRMKNITLDLNNITSKGYSISFSNNYGCKYSDFVFNNNVMKSQVIGIDFNSASAVNISSMNNNSICSDSGTSFNGGSNLLFIDTSNNICNNPLGLNICQTTCDP